MKFNRQELASGALFSAFGLAFGVITLLELPTGTPLRMGPGFFPLALASLLFVLGVAVALRGASLEMGPIREMPWRGLLFVLPIPVLFGLTVRGLGLAVTVFLGVFIAAFASPRMTPLLAAAVGLALSVGCVAIFYFGLKVPIPLFGEWLGPLARIGQ